jgi:hypothetical protein
LFDNTTQLVFNHTANIQKEGSQSIYLIFAKSKKVQAEQAGIWDQFWGGRMLRVNNG